MSKSKLAVAVVAALAAVYSSAYAGDMPANASSTQDASNQPSTAQDGKAKKLQTVVVTGSLIPQTEIETSQPIITITAEQMKARGFSTVAEALQQASFATGSVQGMQDTNSFSPGAETLSMFGLPVSFTKYLIDGRPMGNFPGLYNGSDTFNSISGIPMDMVDHIDVLPGAQSSLYGSDAIAGVINIVLKKHVDAPTLDARYGWYSGGGGANRRISFADGFTRGNWNSMFGVQVESTQPMWRSDRALTRQFNTHGTSPATASRDYLFTSAYSFIGGPTGYQFRDPSNCANVSSQWAGTEGKQYRKGSGYYCGSQYTPGAGTLRYGSKTANFYTHNTLDINDDLQFYGDLLYNYSEKKYTNGSSTMFWGSNVVAAAAGGGYYYDPNFHDLELAQHAFSPEEVGGYKNIMNKETENSYMLTAGARGTFGQSNWDYDIGFTHSDDKLTDRDFQRLAAPMEKYFSDHVLRPQLGTYYGYPEYSPDYAGLYHPVSVADFRSFTGYSTSYAKTWDNLLRGQLTNASLFSLPGGDAGIAVVLEGGNEGWNSTPDPRLLQTVTVNEGNGYNYTTPYFWGTSATPGAGHRHRYAATTELRMPLLKQVTLDVSGRYDAYKTPGSKTLSHGTYNLGLEYRPFDSLLLRARYGTAFKVPTLSDTGQGVSNFYNTVTDYLNCARLGYTGSAVSSCPPRYNSVQYKGTTYGVLGLKPITATAWSYGAVWAPLERMSFSVDYLHWDINNEVTPQSADQLSTYEYLCDVGKLDMKSPTCVNAFAQIQRGPGSGGLLGDISGIIQPKVNTANELVNAVRATFDYRWDIGYLGSLTFASSYSDVLKHTTQAYPGDVHVDVLRHPGFSTDFKTKVNASVTWLRDKWSTTLYVNRYGRTPNYLATLDDDYTDKGTGKLSAWTLWNASVTYNPVKSLGLSLLVNNLFNKMPPIDRSYPGTSNTPYNTDNYNVFGRALYLEANYKFGQGE